MKLTSRDLQPIEDAILSRGCSMFDFCDAAGYPLLNSKRQAVGCMFVVRRFGSGEHDFEVHFWRTRDRLPFGRVKIHEGIGGMFFAAVTPTHLEYLGWRSDGARSAARRRSLLGGEAAL